MKRNVHISNSTMSGGNPGGDLEEIPTRHLVTCILVTYSSQRTFLDDPPRPSPPRHHPV